MKLCNSEIVTWDTIMPINDAKKHPKTSINKQNTETFTDKHMQLIKK